MTSPPLTRYNLHLKLDPTVQTLAVTADIDFLIPQDGLDSLIFYLHRQLAILNIQAPGLRGQRFIPHPEKPVGFTPDAGELHLYFDRPLKAGERLPLRLEYAGQITEWISWSANIVTPEWVELGLYLPWFPNSWDYGQFTYSVDVNCDPEYDVRSQGKRTGSPGGWHFEFDQPTVDIVLIASKELKTRLYRRGEVAVTWHFVHLSISTITRIAEELAEALSWFMGWFGGQVSPDVVLVESPRAEGGGYSRPGLIVLGGLSEEEYTGKPEAYFRYFAHESAHLWWIGADTTTWHDWLNEGFAEYSALLAVREKFGPESFQKRLDLKAESCIDSPPVWELDRGDFSSEKAIETAHIVLYAKAPLLLHRLCQRIGEQRFFELCRQLIAETGVSRGVQWTRTTQDFLDLLERQEGQGTRLWMEFLLQQAW